MAKAAKNTTAAAAAMTVENVALANFEARMSMLRAHRLAATSDDMNKVLGGGKRASVFEFTAAVSSAIDTWGIDTTSIFATDRNPKVIKRFIQFAYAVNAKNYKSVDVVSALILYALKHSGGMPLTTDALHYLGASLKDGRTSPETRGVSKATIGKFFGLVSIGTIPTQASRSCGINGFLQLAGATVGEPGKVNQKVTLNEAHPMVKDFFAMFEAATTSQLDEVGTK